MGTNYYTKENECDHCGRFDEIHLGKSSMGWQFSFQYNGGQYYKNVEEMKVWLESKTITNEYGDKVSNEQFWTMVKKKQVPTNSNHASQYNCYDTEMVINGYSFSDGEFY